MIQYKTNNSILKWILLAVFCLSLLLFSSVQAEASGTCGTNVTWVLSDDGVLTISGSGSIDSHPWTASSVKEVVIENGVTGIGESAFSGCSNLTSITIPDSVESIGNNAFTFSYNIKNIYIDSIESWLTISYGNNYSHPNTSQDCHLFIEDTELTSVTIPVSITSIGDYAFRGCRSITSIMLSNNVISIGKYAFDGCGVTSLTLPNGITSIGDYAFYGCRITSITIPNGVTSIGKSAFESSTLSSITIPNSITSIGDYAFQYCRLTDLSIPNSVTCIGKYAFSSCPYLTNVSIPNSVTSIGDYAFSCCALTSITIPDSMITIGKGVFSNNESLISVAIPDSVTSIGDNAFNSCSNLSSITIPDGVTSIGFNAFYHCSSLTNITIPDSVTNIGNSAFEGCYSLTDIHIDSIESWLTINYGNFSSHPNYSFNCHLYINDTELTSITIPDNMTSIGDYAFKGCRSLTSITIPDSVTNIGEFAFWNCSGLISIDIPDSVTSIGNAAFSECSSLTSITIPDRVTNIGVNAFGRCSSLTSVAIPESVISIGEAAFLECSNLTSIKIPDKVTTIKYETFWNCSSLTNVSIGNSVASIGNNAFHGCGLTGITIPASVTSIGEDAFSDCNRLTKVIFLPDSNSASLSYNSCLFSSSPMIYCYALSSVDNWASPLFGNRVVYLDYIDINTIRTVTLPDDFRMACGDERTLSAGIFPADDTLNVTWASSNPSVISVQDGVITANTEGTATITATVGSLSDSVVITSYIPATSFELSETEAWILSGDSMQLAVGNYQPADSVATITWITSYEALATVNSNGLVSSVMPGNVTITALSEKGIRSECRIHICYPVTAIALSAPRPAMLPGGDMQLTANVTMRTQNCVNHLVTFTSSDENIATVDANTGLVHAVSPGSVTITAASRSGVNAAVDIEIVDDTASVLMLPNNLKDIEEEAFAGLACKIVIIPDGCQSIGSKAFANCTGLLYVQIPASVTSIAEDAFQGCPYVVLEKNGE